MQMIWDCIAWMCRVLQSGIWPTRDFYQKPFAPGSIRAQEAGTPLFGKVGDTVIRGVLCEISADLDEYAKSVGVNHYAAASPCIHCFRQLQDLDETDAPVRQRNHQWVLDSATAAFELVPFDDTQLPALKRDCEPRRPKGGVVAKCRIPEIPEIKRGDRIEPPLPGMVDAWHMQRCVEVEPRHRALLLFRRQPRGWLFFARFFQIASIGQPGVEGLRLEHLLFDSMHVLELGVLAYYMGLVLWKLVLAGFFGKHVEKSEDQVDTAMSRAAKAYFKRMNLPSSDQVTYITTDMLGPKERPYLKLKAGKAKRSRPPAANHPRPQHQDRERHWRLHDLPAPRRPDNGAGSFAGPAECFANTILDVSWRLLGGWYANCLRAILGCSPTPGCLGGLLGPVGFVGSQSEPNNATPKWHAVTLRSPRREGHFENEQRTLGCMAPVGLVDYYHSLLI